MNRSAMVRVSKFTQDPLVDIRVKLTDIKQAVREDATICPAPCKLTI